MTLKNEQLYSDEISLFSERELNGSGQFFYPPVVIVADNRCISACELFVAVFQDNKIAPVFIENGQLTRGGGTNIVELGVVAKQVNFLPFPVQDNNLWTFSFPWQQFLHNNQLPLVERYFRGHNGIPLNLSVNDVRLRIFHFEAILSSFSAQQNLRGKISFEKEIVQKNSWLLRFQAETVDKISVFADGKLISNIIVKNGMGEIEVAKGEKDNVILEIRGFFGVRPMFRVLRKLNNSKK